MPMEAIGFFRETEHGLPKGPSLHDAVHEPMPEEQRSKVADYLRSCPVIFSTSARVPDVLDPDSGARLSVNIHCDGHYVWPDQAAHYVQRYGARLPAHFVSHVTDQPHAPRREELPAELMDDIQAAMRVQR